MSTTFYHHHFQSESPIVHSPRVSRRTFAAQVEDGRSIEESIYEEPPSQQRGNDGSGTKSPREGVDDDDDLEYPYANNNQAFQVSIWT